MTKRILSFQGIFFLLKVYFSTIKDKTQRRWKNTFWAISQNWQMSLHNAVIYSNFHEKLMYIYKMMYSVSSGCVSFVYLIRAVLIIWIMALFPLINNFTFTKSLFLPRLRHFGWEWRCKVKIIISEYSLGTLHKFNFHRQKRGKFFMNHTLVLNVLPPLTARADGALCMHLLRWVWWAGQESHVKNVGNFLWSTHWQQINLKTNSSEILAKFCFFRSGANQLGMNILWIWTL